MTLQRIKPDGPAPPYPIWAADTLTDYLEYLENHCDDDPTFFRGQERDWNLLPKLCRPIGPQVEILAREQLLLHGFKRAAAVHLSTLPRNDWDWLALAQHHGLPTRLLDWTRNPLAALWFTVRRPPEASAFGVVWVFRPDAKDIIHASDAADSPFTGRRTKVFQPYHFVRRISAQNGVFTVHSYRPDQGKFIPLNNNTQQRPRLAKLLVQADAFADMRYELHRCGIHAASLFDDLDGVAECVEWEHTNYSDEVPEPE